MSTDVRDHLDAFQSLTTLPLFNYGEVPGVKREDGVVPPGVTPSFYGLFSVERVRFDAPQMVGMSMRTMWRASIRVVGKTAAVNCAIGLEKVAPIDRAQLTVGGRAPVRVLVERTDGITPDGPGFFSALVRFKPYSL